MVTGRRSALIGIAASVALLAILGACASEAERTETGAFGRPGPQTGATPAQPVEQRPAQPTPAPAPVAPALDSEAGFGLTKEQLSAQQSAQQFEESVAQAGQERVIVRTVDLTVSVTDVQTAMDQVSATARRLGGWVVTTDRPEKHRGFIAVRVPADRVEAALTDIRSYAVDVESESSASRDVTDEYVDLTSRLRNLESTEQTLAGLFDRAATVEDALKVQAELSRVRGQIEEAQGRVNFLRETSAFSLVNVTVRREPVELPVDGGPDRTISAGVATTFTAKLSPPEGVDRFAITWNFGDGSSPVTTDRVAPTLESGVLVTAAVGHVFYDEKASPYIVEVKVAGSGDSGTAEGTDTIIATVSRLPAIDVFAGEDRTATEGEAIEFRASFTRPQGIENLTYEWEFGDGTAGASGAVGPGATEVVLTHPFEHHRPQPYAVNVKLVGQSAAGRVEASDSVQVFVVEAPKWVGGRWDIGDTLRSATRALSRMAEAAVVTGIWIAIFSPLIVLVIVVVLLAVRASRGRRPSP
jgi:hypothetical protein